MRKLTTEEYLKEEEAFWERYSEYLDELREINREENDIPEHKYTKETETYYENERQKLKDEYVGYTDVYYCDFYCLLNASNIQQLINDRSNEPLFREDLKLIGTKVQSNCRENVYGNLKGIAVCMDDIYFLIEDEQTKTIYWNTAVGGVRPFNKKEHPSYVMVENEKGYL